MKSRQSVLLSSFLALCAGGEALGQSEARPASHDWVVREVISPPTNRNYESNWITAIAFRDMNGDQRPELLTDEWRMFPATGEHTFSVSSGVPFEPFIATDLGFHTTWKPYSSATVPCSGLLSRHRTGIAIAGLRKPYYSLPTLVDLSSGTIIDQFIAPPGGPGHEEIALVRYMRSPGDITNDGVEDLFFQAWTVGYPSNSTAGLIDGANFGLVWQQDFEWTSAMVQAETYFPLAEADPDLDGNPDFIAGVVFSNFSTMQEGTLLRAMRGHDGLILWESQLPAIHLSTPACSLIHDVNGDGISDLVLGGGGDPILAVSGGDGSLLWQLPMSEVEVLLPPSLSTVGYVDAFILPVRGADPQARPEAVIQISKWVDQGGPAFYTSHLLRLDARTGRILTLQSLEGDLMPWSPDPLVYWDNSHHYPVGDVDRDGFPEFFRSVHALSLDLPQYPGVPQHFALFGVETLRTPREASLGETLDCRLEIPSAPHHQYRVLVSTAFDTAGGLELDGWPTHLGSSAALSASLATPVAAGTLDAHGIARFSWSTPPRPALVGKTLYSRAVVLKPGSMTEVWTLSTLGQTLLLP